MFDECGGDGSAKRVQEDVLCPIESTAASIFHPHAVSQSMLQLPARPVCRATSMAACVQTLSTSTTPDNGRCFVTHKPDFCCGTPFTLAVYACDEKPTHSSGWTGFRDAGWRPTKYWTATRRSPTGRRRISTRRVRHKRENKYGNAYHKMAGLSFACCFEVVFLYHEVLGLFSLSVPRCAIHGTRLRRIEVNF